MAGVKDNRNSTQGIKLFGATIPVNESKRSSSSTEEIKSKSESSDGDDDNQKKRRLEKALIACPRCKCTDTKFCYFNNYNVNQPRHFCKGCQRYWTAGGALRNVPVGAGRRKNKPPARNDVFNDGGGRGEEWRRVAAEVAEDGGFRDVFPAKRRRGISGSSQSC